MLKVSIAVLASFLCACVSNQDNNCAGYGCHYSEKTALGIRYRSDLIDEVSIQPQEVDMAYMGVSHCFGTWYQPDLLVVVTQNIPRGTGAVYYRSGVIAIKGERREEIRSRDMAHEFTHHFLYLSTGDGDRDHNSVMFDLCA